MHTFTSNKHRNFLHGDIHAMTAVHFSEAALHNPVDVAELVVMDRDWSFDRLDDGELVAEVNGTWSNYRIWFAWQEDLGGLTLSCTFDAKLPKSAMPKVHALLALVNDKLWLGHFAIAAEESAIAFRHSILICNGMGTTAEQIQGLLDIAVQECERFYPAFQSAVWSGKSPAEALEIALFETIAEA